MSLVHIGAFLGGFVGLIVGNLLFPSLPGLLLAALGAYLGAQFARGLMDGSGTGYGRLDPRKTRDMFIRTTFQVMGHVSKADGRVSEQEIGAARAVMRQMALSPQQVTDAINYFTQGKSPDFPLTEVLRGFRRRCRFNKGLIRAFLELQVQVAMVSAGIHPGEREVLWVVCRELGVDRAELAQIEELVRMHMSGSTHHSPRASRPDELASSYGVLGVSKTATDKEVKTAYRRLMNQHHPDKLVARGLPESMMDEAKVKVREIRAAYDLVKKTRGMR